MVKIYKQPFAHDGDTIAIPSVSQPDGKMSSVEGWTVDYQLPKTDPNYKPVGRREMNGVFKEVTEALGQVQVQGAASWSADGAPYPINAQVYHGGKQWIALRANSVEPADGEDWSAWGDSLRQDLANPDKGAAMVGFTQGTAESRETTSQEKMRSLVSLSDINSDIPDSLRLSAALALAQLRGQKHLSLNGSTLSLTEIVQIPEGMTVSDAIFTADFSPTVNGESLITVKSDSVLSNIEIDCKGETFRAVTIAGNAIQVHGLKVTGADWNSVDIAGSSDVEITGLDIQNSGGVFLGGAIHINDSERISISRSKVNGCVGKGVSITESKWVSLKEVKVSNCAYETFYPSTNSEHILIEQCEAIGAIDSIGSTIKCSRNARFVDVVNSKVTCVSTVGGVVSAFHIQGCRNITVSGGLLASDSEQSVLVSNHPESANYTDNVTFSRVEIRATGGTPIRTSTGGFLSHMGSLFVDSCTLIGSAASVITDFARVYLSRLPAASAIGISKNASATHLAFAYITDSMITDAGRIALNLGNLDGGSISGSRIRSAGAKATVLTNCKDIHFSSHDTASDTAEGLEILPTCVGITYVGGHISSGGVALRPNGSDCTFIGARLTGTVSRFGGGVNSVYAAMSDARLSTNSSAPTDGAWNRGDVVLHRNPTVGQPKGWQCTVAGSPGTWVSIGDL